MIDDTTTEDATGGAGVQTDHPQVDLAVLESTLEYIRPALQADGGDLILLGVDGGTVNLQMVGACGGCPLSTMTLKAGIERILTERVPGVDEVNAI
jgi:Fe-S cluster biogenesis protein NfuA